MNTGKIYLPVFMVILLWSCGKKAADVSFPEIISLNPYEAEEYMNLSEIADSLRCILLQTDSPEVMGRVREVIMKKNYIYAMDISQKAVFVFNKEGKYIAKLDKKGPGADEYLFPGFIFIDDEEEYIEVIDYRGEHTVKLKYRNISFELLDKSHFPSISANSCKRVGETYYFATQQTENIVNGKETNAGLLIATSPGNINVLFDKQIETNHSSFSPNIESFAKNADNELFISLMYDNTFYRLEGEEAYPVFTIDFGKYGMNNSIGLKSLEKQLEYIQHTNGVASFPVLNINNDEIMSFSYYFKQDKENRMYREKDFRQYIKLKNKDKAYHVKKIKNDLTSFPDHIYLSSYFFNCAHEVWNGEYLVDILLPDYYFSDNDTKAIYVEGIGEISAYDNPVIVMAKLKKE